MKSNLFLILALLPTMALADTYRETRSLELTAGSVKELKVSCGAGSLKIKGIDGTGLIRVIAGIEADVGSKAEPQRTADKLIELDLKKEYDRALLQANSINQPHTMTETRINLYVELPLGINVNFHDGSGSIDLFKVQKNVLIRESDSGRIDVDGVKGRVTILP